MVILGESDVDILLFAGAHANNLFLKSGNKGIRTQLQVVILTLAAIEGNTVVKAFEIDIGGIAHLGCPLNGLGGSNILCHTVQLCLHLLLRYCGFGLLHLDALIVTQRDLGVNIGGQNDGNHIVIADLHIGQAGAANCLHILLGNRKIIDLRENFLQAVLEEYMSAVHGLDHLAGSLTLTEAGDHDVLAGLHISLLDTGLHQFLIDLDSNGSLIPISFNALYVHYDILPNFRPSETAIHSKNCIRCILTNNTANVHTFL